MINNVLFNYNDKTYITTFGTGHTSKCIPITEMSGNLAAKLVSDLSAAIMVEDPYPYINEWKDVHVRGVVTIYDIKYRVDTEKEDHLIPMLPTPEQAAPVGVKEIVEAEIVEVPPEEELLLEQVPEFLLGMSDAWTSVPPDMDRLKEDGDAYCIENDWQYIEGYYIIDEIKALVRYVHSDKYGVDDVIPYTVVHAWSEHGKRYQ